jgi:hypothetical protein
MATLTLRLDTEEEQLLERAKELSSYGNKTGSGVILEALHYFTLKDTHEKKLKESVQKFKDAELILNRLSYAITEKHNAEKKIDELFKKILSQY